MSSAYAGQGDLNGFEENRIRAMRHSIAVRFQMVKNHREYGSEVEKLRPVEISYDELEWLINQSDENDRFRTALNKLSRLGNGELLGNSDGNMIARRAIQGDDPKTMEEITHIEGTHGGEFS